MQEESGSKLLQSWIARAAARTPQKPWVIAADDGRSVDYADLRTITARFATFLAGRDIGPNDRVALLADNSIEQLLCYFGVMTAGATVCTIHVEMNRNQLPDILDRLKPKLILYQDNLGLDEALTGAGAPRLCIELCCQALAASRQSIRAQLMYIKATRRAAYFDLQSQSAENYPSAASFAYLIGRVMIRDCHQGQSRRTR